MCVCGRAHTLSSTLCAISINSDFYFHFISNHFDWFAPVKGFIAVYKMTFCENLSNQRNEIEAVHRITEVTNWLFKPKTIGRMRNKVARHLTTHGIVLETQKSHPWLRLNVHFVSTWPFNSWIEWSRSHHFQSSFGVQFLCSKPFIHLYLNESQTHRHSHTKQKATWLHSTQRKNHLYPFRRHRRHRYYFIVDFILISCRVFMRFMNACASASASVFWYLFSRMKFYCFQALARTCTHSLAHAHGSHQ